MRVLTLYTRQGCHLCEEALQVLRDVSAEIAFELRVCDIEADEGLLRAYFERIPVVALDGEELFEYHVDAEALRARLSGEGAGPPPDPMRPGARLGLDGSAAHL